MGELQNQEHQNAGIKMPPRLYHHFYLHDVFILSHHLLHILTNNHHQSLNFASCKCCSQRDCQDLSLDPRKDSYWPSFYPVSFPGPISWSQGWCHIYCSHSDPILSFLLFCGPHSTHHKPKFTYLYHLPSWLAYKVYSDLFTTKTIC